MLVLKIGGSLLSPKGDLGRDRALEAERLARRLGRAVAGRSGDLVLAHGVGTVGRRALGRAPELPVRDAQHARRVRNAVGALHRDFVASLRGGRAPIESLEPDELFVLRGGKIVDFDVEPIRAALRHDRVPLTYGCLVSDRSGGYSILSSDQIVEHVARALRPERILWATDVDGVLDPIGRAIPEIDPAAPPEPPETPDDPTGGMAGKLATTVRLARAGFESIVFDGTDPERLEVALRGDRPRGTRIPGLSTPTAL